MKLFSRKRDVWRLPWQVVRFWTYQANYGAVIVLCSHRWEFTAEWCSLIRRDRKGQYYHDYRRTPER